MNLVEPIRSKKQLEAMKKVLKGQSLRDYLLFMVGISSALRISDILKLKVSDVWDGKKCHSHIRLREQKTKKNKGFPITSNLEKAIKEYISNGNYDMDDYLFQSRKGNNQSITRQHAHLILNKAAEEVGIKEPISTHSMRKTWGYWAFKSGYNLALIMEALNHSSIVNTKKYLGITQDELDDVYIGLNL